MEPSTPFQLLELIGTRIASSMSSACNEHDSVQPMGETEQRSNSHSPCGGGVLVLCSCCVCQQRLFSFAKFFNRGGFPVCKICNDKENPECGMCETLAQQCLLLLNTTSAQRSDE
jgi:hypothetical protein